MKLRKVRHRRSRRAKRGVHRSPKCPTLIHYRSNWERLYAEHLDGLVEVASYRYEPYALPYVSNLRTGKVRKYWPDFEVTMDDGSKFLVEIKPKRKLLGVKVKKKTAAALAFCEKESMRFVIVTEDTLKELELL